MMIVWTRIKIMEGEAKRCYSIFVTIQSFKNFCWFNIPDYDWSVITSRKESISLSFMWMNLKCIYPSSMSLIHLGKSRLNIKRPNNRITSSHKNKLFSNLNALYRFFRSNKALHYFIIFQIHSSYHFIPRTSKQHIVLDWNLGSSNWISEFENLSVDKCVQVPKTYGAIVRGCYQGFFSFCEHAINSVGVA